MAAESVDSGFNIESNMAAQKEVDNVMDGASTGAKLAPQIINSVPQDNEHKESLLDGNTRERRLEGNEFSCLNFSESGIDMNGTVSSNGRARSNTDSLCTSAESGAIIDSSTVSTEINGERIHADVTEHDNNTNDNIRNNRKEDIVPRSLTLNVSNVLANDCDTTADTETDTDVNIDRPTNLNTSSSTIGSLPAFIMPESESMPNFRTVTTSTPLATKARTPGYDITPDRDSGILSAVTSSEEVGLTSPDTYTTVTSDLAQDTDGTKKKILLSKKAQIIGNSIAKWDSPTTDRRPASLAVNNEDLSDKYDRLSLMSPSYYTLTPSDDSLDDLDTPDSLDNSMDEVFLKILGPRLSQHRLSINEKLGVISTIPVATPQVVALPVEAKVDIAVDRLDSNSSHRRLIPLENGVTTFGTIDLSTHSNDVSDCGPARLETMSVTDHPLSNTSRSGMLPSDTSYQDIHLNIDMPSQPSVSYRSTTSLHYNSDIVPLDEVYTRDFKPEELKNGQHVASVYPRECHGWTGANLSPESMPVQLINLQVTDQDYATALKWLSKDIKIAWHTVLYNKWLQVGLFSLIFITLWMLGFLLWHTGGLPDRIGIGLFFILAWLFMVVGLIVCRLVRNSLNKKTETTLSAVNDIFLRYNVIMGVEDKGAMACNRIILHFLFFREGPCLERVLDNLNKGMQKNRKFPKLRKKEVKLELGPEIEIDESDLMMKRDMTDGQRQELAKRLMLK